MIASEFSIPWGVAVFGEDELLITDRLGTLYHHKNGTTQPLSGTPQTYHVEFAGLIYGGLMDVSLHPNFDTNRLVYISYVGIQGKMLVARFKFQDDTIDKIEIVFRSNSFSIGSRIEWDDHNHFYVSQGLGGNPYPEPGPQNLGNDGGKIHRLHDDGQIPQDNPIFDTIKGPTSIWTYGHRDPQGLFFDRDAGVLYANEHGPLGGDEFNIIYQGKNYGWPLHSYGKNYDNSEISTITEEEARTTTVLPEKHWDKNINVAPSSLLKLKNSNFTLWNGSFIMGSLPQQRLVTYNLQSGKTEIVLENIGRVRDIAQLSNGNLIVLVDAGSPNSSDRGRILEIWPKEE